MTKKCRCFNRSHWPGIYLGLALISFAPHIAAMGLGEIHVTSKLGEYFSGRIPILSTPGESVEPSCFKLLTESPTQNGTPFIDSARLTVNGGSGEPYLKISSRKRIGDLAVRLLIKAGCESEITREYTILLDLPDSVQTARSDQAVVNTPLIEPALSPPKPVLSAGQRDRRPSGVEWEIKAGESLAGIAASIYPDSRRLQRKFVRQAIVANSEVLADKNPGEFLSVGTVLHLPKPQELAPKPAEKKPDRRSAAEPTAQLDTKPDKPPVSRKTAKAKKPGPDEVRLKLTTGDLDVSASGKITEGEREILREKQRILMDLDDMAAYNLSLNHRLKQMEEHIQELQAKLEGLERQRSEMASSRLASSALTPPPVQRQSVRAWPAYTGIVAFSAVGVGLLMVVLWSYSKWKRKRAEADALMEFDLDLGRVLDAAPEEIKPGSSASPSPSDAVNAGVQMDQVVVPVYAPEIVGQTSSVAPKGWNDVSDSGFDITLDSIESAIEEADIYLVLGEKDRAIANLKYHIDSHPKSTVDLWLKLLGIYHDFDMRMEFESLATEFRQYFNIAKPKWETMESGESSSRCIEEFPLLMDKISSTWGSPACLEYLHHLLLDNKGGRREGFELGVASDILLIIRVLEEELGKFADETPSEELRALEFTLEPSAPVEHEESDLGLPKLEFDRLPIVEPVGFPESSPVRPASVRLAKVESSPVADTRSELERRHPRIVENLALTWGTPEAVRYLESLVVDKRGGRVGFDKEAASELMMLYSIVTAKADEDVIDIWGFSEENKLAAKKTLRPRKS